MSNAVILEPLIEGTVVIKSRVRFFLNKEFSKKYTREALTLTYSSEIDLESLPPSVLNIPLITNVIATVWFSGNRYTIEEMDEDLYYSLQKIKKFFQRFFYNTEWEGELIPGRLVKNSIPQTHLQSASMFSGGLDSTATVLRHINENPMLISLNGLHKQALDFVAVHQLAFNQINMNSKDFLKLSYLNKASIDITKWFWDTSMGLSLVGTAAPFLYAKGIPVLYIPAGFTWRHFLFPDGQTLQQPASPLIDENLSPMGLRVVHDGFSMTRTDKIKFISTFCSQHSIPKPQLVVCTYCRTSDNEYTHCNKCFKCQITMLDIMAIGDRLHEYGFTQPESEFIFGFKSYVEKVTMRRGGTYGALNDTQQYVKQNLEKLPRAYYSFFEWFASIDFESRLVTSSSRPLRSKPFKWSDYEDVYSGVKDYVDE